MSSQPWRLYQEERKTDQIQTSTKYSERRRTSGMRNMWYQAVYIQTNELKLDGGRMKVGTHIQKTRAPCWETALEVLRWIWLWCDQHSNAKTRSPELTKEVHCWGKVTIDDPLQRNKPRKWATAEQVTLNTQCLQELKKLQLWTQKQIWWLSNNTLW